MKFSTKINECHDTNNKKIKTNITKTKRKETSHSDKLQETVTITQKNKI